MPAVIMMVAFHLVMVAAVSSFLSSPFPPPRPPPITARWTFSFSSFSSFLVLHSYYNSQMDSCHIFYPRPRPRPRCLSSFTSFLGLRSFQEPDAFPRFHLSQSYSSHFCLRPQHRLSMILSSSSFLRIFFLFLVFLVLNPPLPPGRSWNGTTATDGLSTLFIKFASHTYSSSMPLLAFILISPTPTLRPHST